jgi:hypothetical protein
MMDNASTDPLSSRRLSREVSFMDFVGHEKMGIGDGDVDDVYYEWHYLEMFRRACEEGNRGAQRWLLHRFGAVVVVWMHAHPRWDLACHLHTEEYYVIQTFKRCWLSSLHQDNFKFNSMADVLNYLRVSLNGVILDELRGYSRHGRAPLLKPVVAEESKSIEGDSSHEVWRVIDGRLSNARERRLAYLLFHCALKPGEIVHHCPKEFSDVREVSRMRRDIMELISQ